jgi:hypothetical protein
VSIDDPFRWGSEATATSQPHAPARPTDSQIAQGYPEGQPVTAEEFNWALRQIGLARAGKGFTDLQDLIDLLAAGESGLLLEDVDGAAAPGTDHTTAAGPTLGASSAGSGLDVAGNLVVYFADDRVIGDKRDLARSDYVTMGSVVNDLGTVQFPLSHTTAPLVRLRVVTNGVYVVALYRSNSESYVECWDIDGTARWCHRVDNDPALNDVAIDADRCYVVHDATSFSRQLTALTLDTATVTGTVAWTFAHGAQLYSVAVGGGRVFVAGAASTNVVLRALKAEDGTQVAPIGWDVEDAGGGGDGVATTSKRSLATDGEYLWQVFETSASAELVKREATTGRVVESRAWADPHDPTWNALHVAVDHDYVYVATFGSLGGAASEGGVHAFRKGDLAHVWSNPEDSADVAYTAGLASDGAGVFTFVMTTTTTYEVRRLYRGNRPTRFYRHDGSGNYVFPRTLAAPER